MLKNCIICDTEFETIGNKKTCSLRCSEENRIIMIRDYTRNHPHTLEKKRQYRQERYQKKRNDPAFFKKEMFIELRARARRKGIKFNIELEDIQIPDKCPVFDIELERRPNLKDRKYGISVDRIDNSKGYIKGNIQVISYKANTHKGDLSKEELLKLAKWINEAYADA
jgi:hypothetical protein